MTARTIEQLQRDVCKMHHVEFVAAPNSLKVGIASNVRNGNIPINGFRHPPEGDTTGWYIYAGEELSDSSAFFNPLHVKHLGEWCPEIRQYLGLPPGWRFLVAGDYEDVWFDKNLLKV